MRELVLASPVKVNWFLRVTGMRADGYHELQTAYQLLDYYDVLKFIRRHDGQIRVSMQAPVELEKNLIYRAAKQLKAFARADDGASIVCYKRIPMGSGLGGGSSNAATVLHALNHLWNLGMTREEMAEIGLSLGADVPVFVHGGNACAEGIGEHLQAMPEQQGWYLVVTPKAEISTARLFAHAGLKRDCAKLDLSDSDITNLENVFLPLVLKEYPEVKQAYDWLAEFAEPRLTGTGSAIFARFEEKTQAESVWQKRPEKLNGFIAKSLANSSLFDWLNKYLEV